MTTGVYQIRNVLNNKIYIGSTAIDFNKRFKQHIKLLKRNKHTSIALQRAFNKYGISNFKFEILEKASPKNVRKLEQLYLNKTPDYNCSYVAYGGNTKHNIEYVKQIIAEFTTEKYTTIKLAKKYNTCPQTVSNIVTGKSYKNFNLLSKQDIINNKDILKINQINSSKINKDLYGKIKFLYVQGIRKVNIAKHFKISKTLINNAIQSNIKPIVVKEQINNKISRKGKSIILKDSIEELIFESVKECAKFLKCSSTSILRYIKQNKKYNNFKIQYL